MNARAVTLDAVDAALRGDACYLPPPLDYGDAARLDDSGCAKRARLAEPVHEETLASRARRAAADELNDDGRNAIHLDSRLPT